ncbi:MAG: hypothetical protein LBJ63_08350 [Prevotellaceae bacterium]|jgi:hypothetical protein|nr:hypothetical protein [Prevotellaceae bacterium]
MERIIKITVILAFFCVLIPQKTQAQSDDDRIVYLKAFYECRKEYISATDSNICFSIQSEPQYPSPCVLFGYPCDRMVDSIMLEQLLDVCDTLSLDYHIFCLQKTFSNTDNVKIISKKEIIVAPNLDYLYDEYECDMDEINVSPIIYNENKTMALFYFDIYPENGGFYGGRYGCFAVCEKKGGEWKVKEIITVIES